LERNTITWAEARLKKSSLEGFSRQKRPSGKVLSLKNQKKRWQRNNERDFFSRGGGRIGRKKKKRRLSWKVIVVGIKKETKIL